MIKNADLKKRILEISHKHKLSHLGSVFTAVDIIEDIFQKKKRHERFVLSSGHAGLALYVVLEKHGFIKNAEDLLYVSGIHPDRPTSMVYDPELETNTSVIDFSSGSLGHGLGASIGMALANRKENVYCLISDGELAEGSIHEALRIADELKLTNLCVYVNWNGYGAYRDTNNYYCPISSYVNIFEVRTDCSYIPFLQGLQGHYKIMNEEDYKLATEILDETN